LTGRLRSLSVANAAAGFVGQPGARDFKRIDERYKSFSPANSGEMGFPQGQNRRQA
jgi:hypothetical protein